MIVNHRFGHYEVRFDTLSRVFSELPKNRWIITDDNVARIYGRWLKSDDRVIVVPAGEASKSIERYARCLEALSAGGANRNSTLVAFGGGVVGDLAGFVAATYMRGVHFIQVPTTLLAQVDSSVGGKVGIDLPSGKNLVGAFHAPDAVLVCVETLDTLDSRQFANGLAEVWKCGFIADSGFVNHLRSVRLTPGEEMAPIVERCIEIKAGIVEQDELDQSGLRATLNFGHTVGHALEQVTGYSLLHGEAISIGMVVEARLAANVGLAPLSAPNLVEECLHSQGLPTRIPPATAPADLISAMRRDKKRVSDGLSFSLLTQIGECKLVEGIQESEVQKVLSGE